MSQFLIMFEEAGGLETHLVKTKGAAIATIQAIRDEYHETDKSMVSSTTIYEVVATYKYEPPVAFAGLKKEGEL